MKCAKIALFQSLGTQRMISFTFCDEFQHKILVCLKGMDAPVCFTLVHVWARTYSYGVRGQIVRLTVKVRVQSQLISYLTFA